MSGIVPTMREFKAHKLRSSSGQLVTNPKQAIAIGLSEDRRAGRTVPPPPRRKRRASIGSAIGARLAARSS